MATQNTFQWSDIRLAVFDVDGTLYRQSKLRWRMARDLIVYSLRTRNFTALEVLKTYRRQREEIGEAEIDNFEQILLANTAEVTGCSQQTVVSIVEEWILRRPLPYLARCRYPGVTKVFDSLNESGRHVGILSDYPVGDKLAALGLFADHMVGAGDAEVGIQKPHPRGLQRVIDLAGTEPHQTVLIGDRAERDGFAARRAGAHALILSEKSMPGWTTFRHFDDPVFASLCGRP